MHASIGAAVRLLGNPFSTIDARGDEILRFAIEFRHLQDDDKGLGWIEPRKE